VWKEIPLSLLAAFLVAVMANDRLIDKAGTSELTRIDGVVLLLFFVVFLYNSASIARDAAVVPGDASSAVSRPGPPGILIAAGFGFLILGGAAVVHGAVELARDWGFPETAVGATVVAVGTSLPELATSAVAAYRGNSDIAVGNVVGSNIFNIFFILGVSSLVRPLPFSSTDSLHLGGIAVASLLLLVFMRTGKKLVLDSWEASLFLCLYVVYVWLTLHRGAL